MKTLTLVCAEKIEDDVLILLSILGIKGYTVFSGVGGSGEKGIVSGKGGWTDRNKLYLIASEDEHIAPLVNGVKELHVRLVQERQGHAVPLKAFLQPCELIV